MRLSVLETGPEVELGERCRHPPGEGGTRKDYCDFVPCLIKLPAWEFVSLLNQNGITMWKFRD